MRNHQHPAENSVGTVEQFLRDRSGQSVFFDPLFGNHGDHLITLGSEWLFDRCEMNRVDEPAAADLLLINGGGGMADPWPGLRIVRQYSQRYPDTPLAILPSSFLFNDQVPRQVFAGRTAEAWLWAREQPSFDLVTAADWGADVRVGLDHDMALQLQDHPMIDALGASPARGKVLVVERDDWEGTTARRRPLSLPGLGFIPERWREWVRKPLVAPLRRRQDKDSMLKAAALNFIREAYPEARDLVVHCEDISLAESGDFDAFLRSVAEASLIITSRLHVAILGQLLGRRVCLVEGAYHKARGVYQYSLKSRGGCELLALRGGQLIRTA